MTKIKVILPINFNETQIRPLQSISLVCMHLHMVGGHASLHKDAGVGQKMIETMPHDGI